MADRVAALAQTPQSAQAQTVALELRDKARMAEQLQAFRQALPEAAVVLAQLDLLAQQI
jgi:hypothetical protein